MATTLLQRLRWHRQRPTSAHPPHTGSPRDEVTLWRQPAALARCATAHLQSNAPRILAPPANRRSVPGHPQHRKRPQAERAGTVREFPESVQIQAEITQLGQTPVGPKDFAEW